MIIRLEDTKDYREVENLTREAFSISIEPIPTLYQSWIL